MIEWLESVDRSIVLAVNSIHTPWLDELMWLVSGKFFWIPFYLFLLFLAYKKYGFKKSMLFLLVALICVGLADLISSQLIKNIIERYRPSHHALLTNKLHFYEIKPGEFYKGGQFGFVSSHAANFFAMATFIGLSLEKSYKWLFPTLIFIAVLVSFSRLYLGVHYLSDLIGGALIGILVSYTVWRTWWRG
jgi:undecaprenyl-diphosphatase